MMRLLVLFCFGWIVWTACVRSASVPACMVGPAAPELAGLANLAPGMVHPAGWHFDVDVDLDNRHNLFAHSGGNQSCGPGSVCNFECPDGNCAFACESGSVCNVSCDGGNCSLACGAGAVCNHACDGGSCSTSCEAGSTCNVDCDGGSCSGTCEPGAVCAGKCDGGHCG